MHSLPSRAGLGLALLLASGSIASAQIVHNPANGHYYEAVQAPTIASWHEARREAHTRTHLGLKGHLVTITDAAENAFVLGLPGFVEDFWIGGYQDTDDPSYSEPGGGWKWVTGEPFSYTDWGLGQPNNSLGQADFRGRKEHGGLRLDPPASARRRREREAERVARDAAPRTASARVSLGTRPPGRSSG